MPIRVCFHFNDYKTVMKTEQTRGTFLLLSITDSLYILKRYKGLNTAKLEHTKVTNLFHKVGKYCRRLLQLGVHNDQVKVDLLRRLHVLNGVTEAPLDGLLAFRASHSQVSLLKGRQKTLQ